MTLVMQDVFVTAIAALAVLQIVQRILPLVRPSRRQTNCGSCGSNCSPAPSTSAEGQHPLRIYTR